MSPRMIVRMTRACLPGACAAAVLAALVAGCAAAPPQEAAARIGVAARPNGIAVRPGDGALFITDDRSNAILQSAGGVAYTRYASLPALAGQPDSLSQLAFVSPDTLLVERFGFGSAGAVIVVSASGDAAALTGLAPQRRRLGLAPLGPGSALSSWFVKRDGQPDAGGVSLVTYDAATRAATERDLIVGLAKPVGLALSRDTLFVSDQASGVILGYALKTLLAARSPASGGAVFARVDTPDLLAADRAGALYTKCGPHGLCRIAPDGAVTKLADDFGDARGVAVDDARHRLYAVDRAKGAVRIFPLDDATPGPD